jgi:phosphatidylglycerol:prolipoprotein diacylglycerol transferase
MSLYGLIVGIAILIGLEYFQKHSQLKYFPYILVSTSIIGARIYHVAEQWSYYSTNPSEIIATWHGGLSIIGALIFGLIYTFLYSIKFKLNIFKLLNFITPILPLCQAIGRLGNWVNRENPIWWPEAILDLLLFFIIKKFPQNPTAKYLIGYGLIRFVTEFWRQDTWVYGSIKIGQIVAVILIALGLFANGRHKEAHPPKS